MSIGKGESKTVRFEELIGGAVGWDQNSGDSPEAGFYKRLRIDVTRITQNGATLPGLKESLQKEAEGRGA